MAETTTEKKTTAKKTTAKKSAPKAEEVAVETVQETVVAEEPVAEEKPAQDPQFQDSGDVMFGNPQDYMEPEAEEVPVDKSEPDAEQALEEVKIERKLYPGYVFVKTAVFYDDKVKETKMTDEYQKRLIITS